MSDTEKRIVKLEELLAVQMKVNEATRKALKLLRDRGTAQQDEIMRMKGIDKNVNPYDLSQVPRRKCRQ